MDVAVKRLARNLVESPEPRYSCGGGTEGHRIDRRPLAGARPRETIVHDDPDVTLPLSYAFTHAVV